jgi:hypothetical protein
MHTNSPALTVTRLMSDKLVGGFPQGTKPPSETTTKPTALLNTFIIIIIIIIFIFHIYPYYVQPRDVEIVKGTISVDLQWSYRTI